MRILGIDYGEKRIGIAVSDPLGLTAQPRALIENNQDTLDELDKIIKDYSGVEEIVVGLPKTMKGEMGSQADKVVAFVDSLRSRFSIPITTWDERLTTAAAEKHLIAAGVSRAKRKKVIDKSAATLILQSYLDSK